MMTIQRPDYNIISKVGSCRSSGAVIIIMIISAIWDNRAQCVCLSFYCRHYIVRFDEKTVWAWVGALESINFIFSGHSDSDDGDGFTHTILFVVH